MRLTNLRINRFLNQLNDEKTIWIKERIEGTYMFDFDAEPDDVWSVEFLEWNDIWYQLHSSIIEESGITGDKAYREYLSSFLLKQKKTTILKFLAYFLQTRMIKFHENEKKKNFDWVRS